MGPNGGETDRKLYKLDRKMNKSIFMEQFIFSFDNHYFCMVGGGGFEPP